MYVKPPVRDNEKRWPMFRQFKTYFPSEYYLTVTKDILSKRHTYAILRQSSEFLED